MKNLSKDEMYLRIFETVVDLEYKKGHLNWSVTMLAQKSGVSRTLIYYYFGKKKENIILGAIRYLGEDLIGVTPRRLEYWKKGQIEGTLMESRRTLARLPGLIPLYYRLRTTHTQFGKSIRDLETKQKAKFSEQLPQLKNEEVEAFFALMMGLAFAPDISPDAVKSGCRWLQTVTSGKVR